MKRLSFLVLGSISIISTYAQNFDPEKVPAKALKTYFFAVDALRDGDWPTAKVFLNKAGELYPNYVDVWLSMGAMYGQLKKYDSAVYFYNKGYQIDSVYSNDFRLQWSIYLAGLGRFEEAKDMAEKLIVNQRTHPKTVEAAKYRLKSYTFAVDFEKKHGKQQALNLHNLGDSINSTSSEYYPSFTIDDSIMVFTRRGKGIREDFIKTEKTATGYRKAVVVDGPLNKEPSKGGTNISQDGDWLVFAGNFASSGYGNFDIYLSDATPEGWSEPYNLGENINTEFWESSPSLSPDKQSLYFSSDRPGGYGGKDLYVSHRRKNGSWGPAENMGPNFNTSYDELAPFIHADNQTLYFTSGGHDNYGASDIFVSRKGPGGQWSVAENLGYPINTIAEEGSMIVAADGKTAYFAGNWPDSRGGLDLYSFELPTFARPKRTLWIKGEVRDAVSNKGLPSEIELKDINTGHVLENVITDETGFYLVTLPVGHDYTFTVNRKGYLFYSDNFMLATKPSDSTYRKDIMLQPLQVNAMLELKNIFFETNAFALDPASFVELDKLVQLLKDNPTLKIQVSGHTDNVGSAADNLKLSNNRAKSVVDYLVSKGIDASRLTYKGYGASKPIAPNATDEGKAKNRRTEILVTGN